ncbi:hypothetical protein D3C76_1301750 [compost metagenome]
MAILTGSPFTRLRILRISGSNRPASIIRPKNRMANNSKAADGATIFRPSSIILPSSGAKPPMTAKTIGTTVSATIGDRRLLMIR